jgi:hypothetical protein
VPLSTNPNARAAYWLASDANVPSSTRPVFLVRFMQPDEHSRHQAILEQASAEPDDRRCAELLIEAVRIGIDGWRNFPQPFSDQAFFDLLSDRERWEVAWNYPAVVRLTPTPLAAPVGGTT